MYSTGYILWVAALLGACDVSLNGHHLGFYPKLEITKNGENLHFLMLDMLIMT